MNAHHFGAPYVSEKAPRARDHIDSSNKLHSDTSTSYSIPQPAINTNDISQQTPKQKIATSSDKPPSRTCSSFPQGQGSSRRGTTVDPKRQAADLNPQRDRHTFGLGTTLRDSSCVSSICQAREPSSHLCTPPMNETSTTDNSINTANIPDNRVNNGHIKIGNSSSRVSRATMSYSNDITHLHIGTLQCNVWMPPELYNPGPPPGDQGHRVSSQNRTRKRRSRRPKHEDRRRTIWRSLWCLY